MNLVVTVIIMIFVLFHLFTIVKDIFMYIQTSEEYIFFQISKTRCGFDSVFELFFQSIHLVYFIKFSCAFEKKSLFIKYMIKLSISNPDNLKEICKEKYEASIISFRIK